MPDIIVERGREKGLSFKLQPGAENVIGRDPAAVQVVISDVAASRRHFHLFARGGKWYVADLGSRNGTFLNEEKVDGEIELNSGDRVQVGETVFSFLEEEKAEPGKAGGLQGKEIGGYEIMERIGRGGMGTVYKARQKSMHRVVALKFLSPKLSSNPAFVNQFRAEARAAGQLNHPNVVQALDVFELNGLHCFSMEFMEGGCVQDLLSKREDSRLPWEEALPLLVDATRGLVFAEKRGIIHRDIKPDNLMLTSEQKVKIGDLGLAKSAGDIESAGATGIFGTPHFIAPEQAQGKSVTHAADIYALGATFYRMVAGRTPFSGATVKEILRAQIGEPHKPVAEIVPDFPKDLSAVIDKMMAKKLDDRYTSATKLLEDLEAFQLAHQIELAGGVKSRKPFLIALAVLLAALGAIIAYIALKEPPPPDIRTTTVTVIQPSTVVGKTPEEIQERHDLRAKSDYQDLQIEETKLGKLEELLNKPEGRNEWLRLADQFEALQTKHPEAKKYVNEAAEHAKEMRKQLEDYEKNKTEVIDKQKAWWKAINDTIARAGREKRWADAVVKSKEALKEHPDWLDGPYLPPGSKGVLEKIQSDAYSTVSSDVTNAQGEADRLIAGGDFKRAIDVLAKAEEDLVALVQAMKDAGIDDPRYGYANLLEQARTVRKAKETAAGEALLKLLDADKIVFINAYRSIRRTTDTGGSVFLYRFADAAKELRAATDGKLKTYLYKHRVAKKASDLEAMQAAWEDYVRLYNEGKLFAANEELKGMPGAEAGTQFRFDGARPSTPTEVNLVKTVGTSGRTNTSRDWGDLTPSELHKVFIAPKLDKIPKELSLPLLRIFVELGEESATTDLLDRVKDLPPEFAWLRSELSARTAFGFLVKMGADATTTADAARKAVTAWRFNWRTTDTFLLFDGRDAELISENILPDEEHERFMVNWGAETK